MMKIGKILVSASLLALGGTITAVQAEDGSEVSYEDALRCGALYSVLTASLEGEPEEEVLEDIAIRWVTVAMLRDGTEDGSRADAEIEGTVEELTGKIMEYGEDQESIDEFLTAGVGWCEGKQELIADEFESIEYE